MILRLALRAFSKAVRLRSHHSLVGAFGSRLQRGFISPALLGVLAMKRGSTTPEPNPANVVLLIQGDERPFIDVSNSQYLVSNYRGGAALDTTTKPFGAGTLYLGASDGHDNKLVVPETGSIFQLGALFAIEATVYADFWPGNVGARIFDTRPSTPSNGWVFAITANGALALSIQGGTGNGTYVTANNVVSQTTFTHVKCTYDGTTLRMWVGGVNVYSAAQTINVTVGVHLFIGSAGSSGVGAGGQRMCGMRIVKGEATNTTNANFTPPSAPLTSPSGAVLSLCANIGTASNVKLLNHYEGADGSTTITDSSPSARTFTVFGNLQIDTAQFKFGTSSLLVDGNGDYATTPNSADFNFGTGDWSAETWARFASASPSQWMLNNYQGASNGWGFALESGTGRFTCNITGDVADVRSQDNALTTSVWYHLASFRFTQGSAQILALSIDGEVLDFILDSSNITSTAALSLARLTGFAGTYFNGWMDETRVVKSECPFKRSFALQTSAY